MTESNCLTQMLNDYGMCKNNRFVTPEKALQTKHLTTAAIIFAGLATVFAIVGRQEGAKIYYAAGVCKLLVAALSCAAFSVYASWDYQTAVRDGKAGLIMAGGSDTCSFVMSTASDSYVYGPAFGLVVVAFVVSLLNAIVFFLAGGRGEEPSYGEYGAQGGRGAKYI